MVPNILPKIFHKRVMMIQHHLKINLIQKRKNHAEQEFPVLEKKLTMKVIYRLAQFA